jgi:hypothetical protein
MRSKPVASRRIRGSDRPQRADSSHSQTPVVSCVAGRAQRGGATDMDMLKELIAFLFARKKYWLWPVFLMMALLGVLIVLAHGSALAPFIYTIF